MKNNNLDKYLDIVNEEKIKRGMDNFIPLYPMFRVENDNLLEYNKIIEKDFVIENLIEKNITNKEMELSKYTVEKNYSIKTIY